MGKNAISIRDVAKRSGVSIATVSNVLNNRCNVSDALRERVYRAVEELDYVANPIARSMRSSRTFTVGVMVVDLNCIFFAPLLKGIQNVLSKAGYSVITYDSNYDGETEKKYVRMMRNNLVDGLIIAGLSDTQNKAFYTQLTQACAAPVIAKRSPARVFPTTPRWSWRAISRPSAATTAFRRCCAPIFRSTAFSPPTIRWPWARCARCATPAFAFRRTSRWSVLTIPSFRRSSIPR